MRYYNKQHKYYCGIDLHARTIYICILDQSGKTLLHKNIDTEADQLLKLILPYMPDIVIAVECIFTWYWIADFCEQYQIPFVLGHVLYMKAIHGSKTKNDRIDSHKIAVLLRGGMIPMAYVYPAKMRSTRDLLRRRMFFMRKRSELLAHIKNTNNQYNLHKFENSIAPKRFRNDIKDHFPEKMFGGRHYSHLCLRNR
ncbi:transposase [candidate division KSB1 bacterium]|nr:transposase [candidate division KSB1 bacterium]